MADSIREKIIQNAVTRAGLIKKTNGYKTDVGTNAERALKTQDDDTTETVVISPKHETSTKEKFGKMSHVMPLDISAAVKYNPDTETISPVSEEIYADLIKAFTRTSSIFSTFIDSITHTGGGGLEMPNNEEQFAGALATFEIKYKTALGDPEAQ